MPFASSSRSALRRLLLPALFLLGLAPIRGQTAADGFAPDVDGVVHAVALQPDGKILLGGQFATVDGFPRANLARLHPDGSVDQSFDPALNGPVRAIAVQRDGRLVVGGDFTSFRPRVSGAAVVRNRLARLNADGSLDSGFNPNPGGPLQPQVHALLVQADGRIVAGGTFTTVQPNGAAAATPRTYLARFNADGSLDSAFNPAPNGIVLALALHVDNRLIVAGGFTALSPGGSGAAVTRNRLARLNVDGSVDGAFDPNANNVVNAVAVQRDGKVLFVGAFTALQPPGSESPIPLQRLARLNVDGSIDGDFYPRVNGPVGTVAVQGDGRILVGGGFTSVWGRGSASVTRGHLARFGPDGTVDTGFAPVINGAVNALAVQADGKLVLGGLFTRVTPEGGVTALVRNRVARLNANGSLDTAFELDAGGRILASVTQADGRVVIGGSFTSVAGTPRTYLARLAADGTLDPSFRPELNDRVYALALQSDGRILAAGAFTTAAGARRDRLVRINADGSVDPNFFPHFDGPVGSLLVLADGRILVGGTFNSVTPVGATEVLLRSNLVRLNANGTLDTAFDPNPNSTVAAMALQPDGKLLIGGVFSAVRPGASSNTSASFQSRGYLARLETNGTLDTSFVPVLNAQVSTLVLQADGKVVIGGAFTTVVGSDGKLDKVKRDDGTTADAAPVRNHLARLETNGNLDASYNPNANANVLASALQPDGKVVIGGAFTTLQPNGAATFTLRKYAARLNPDGSVDPAFDLDLSESPGNRVDSLRLLADGRLYLGGTFNSLRPAGTAAPVARRQFARLQADGRVDLAFDAAAGGVPSATVHALALQPDGRVLAVGAFSDLGGARSVNVARFRPEGTPDPDFSPALATDGPVHAVVVRTTGAPVPTQLGGFAWLAANGTLRSAFAAAATRLSGEISAVAVDARGRLLLGGSFANLSGSTGGNLVRFLPNGNLDASFNPRPNGAVTGIVVQPDTRILVVGSFTTVAAAARNRIARIDDDGSLDVTYDPSANAAVNAIVLQPDGKAVVGGVFTSFTPNLTTTAVPRNYLARINENGTLDTSYNPSPNSNVNALVLQPDGKVVAGGLFTSVVPNATANPITRNHLARFNADGSPDTAFDPSPNAQVDALALYSNGQLLLGGAFSSLQPGGAGAVLDRANLARVNADGTVDAAFQPSPNAPVRTVAIQADGAAVLGGAFTSLQPGAAGPTVTRNRLARVNRDGTVDLDFNPDIRGSISVVSARPDGSLLVGGSFADLQLNGSIMVGGDFSGIGGAAARHLAMLNDNGSVATSFQPRPNAPVRALLALPDGRTLAGGSFTSIAGAARAHLVRFNADGGLDSAYNPAVDRPVTALALQPDGRVLVGHAGGLLRLNANGTADASFSATLGGPVTGLAVQPDGRVLALQARSLVRLTAAGAPAGEPLAAGDLRAFSLLADGGVLVAGDGAITAPGGSRTHLALLRASGDLVLSFDAAADAGVTALALQADGRLMAGGRFRRIGGVSRPAIARLAGLGTGAQTLGVAANRGSVILSRSGPVPEASAVIFEQSSDFVSWTVLGGGVRAAGSANWQVAGLNLPAAGTFYLRARVVVAGSAGVSAGLLETTREFNYASPVPGLAVPGGATAAPASAAQLVIDGPTGVIPRSVVTTVPGEGTVEIFVQGPAAASATGPARLVNLSTRGRVASGSPLVLGFAIAGEEPRRVLVRGAGPALAAFGVEGAVSAPRLEVHRTGGERLGGNEGWGGAAELARVAAETGAFPFAPGSADSAAVLTLAPGTYTIQVSDARGAGGAALAEIYDAGSGARSRLVNVSSLGTAGSGADALISGFVIDGGATARVLLRGVGPGLEALAGRPTATDPVLALYDAAGAALGANDNWVSSVPEVAEAARRAGAFALAPGSRDAAVLATLPAGVYTVQVSAGAPAPALLEVYEVRP